MASIPVLQVVQQIEKELFIHQMINSFYEKYEIKYPKHNHQLINWDEIMAFNTSLIKWIPIGELETFKEEIKELIDEMIDTLLVNVSQQFMKEIKISLIKSLENNCHSYIMKLLDSPIISKKLGIILHKFGKLFYTIRLKNYLKENYDTYLEYNRKMKELVNQLISVDNGLHYGILSNEIKMIEKKQKELFPHSICNLCGFYCNIDYEIKNINEQYLCAGIHREYDHWY